MVKGVSFTKKQCGKKAPYFHSFHFFKRKNFLKRRTVLGKKNIQKIVNDTFYDKSR